MRYKVFIFDFDGTLVDSNRIKQEAFYSVSAEAFDNQEIVDLVLTSMPEHSRFEIIEKVYSLISAKTGRNFSSQQVQEAINMYSATVRERILSCPEINGASSILPYIKEQGGEIFISSNTPEEFLGELIQARAWGRLVAGHFGFPRKKTETISVIRKRMNVLPSDVLIVGDGISDKISAEENGCSFFGVTHDRSLLEVMEQISKYHSDV